MVTRGFIKTGKKVFIARNVTIHNSKNISFGKNVTIDKNCILDGYSSQKIRLGNGVKIGAYSSLSSTSHLSKYGKGLTIGNNSAIGQFTEFGAAGGIEAVFSVLAIYHKILPPTINYVTPDPDCDLDYVPNVARRADVRVVLKNSFGFGGQNACLVFRRFED